MNYYIQLWYYLAKWDREFGTWQRDEWNTWVLDLNFLKVWRSHSDVAEDLTLLECDTLSGEWFLTFWRFRVLSSAGVEQAGRATALLDTWSWRQCDPSKLWDLLTQWQRHILEEWSPLARLSWQSVKTHCSGDQSLTCQVCSASSKHECRLVTQLLEMHEVQWRVLRICCNLAAVCL